MNNPINIFWFRRDLRAHDNLGLSMALKGSYPVLTIFIFDTEILEQLPEDDARVTFIHETLQGLKQTVSKAGDALAIYHGKPLEVFERLTKKFNVQNIITNRDYEPYALERDKVVAAFLAQLDIGFYTYKDHVVFEKDEIVKSNGEPYKVYTPYMKQWKAKFREDPKLVAPLPFNVSDNLVRLADPPNPSLQELGFKASEIKVPAYRLSEKLIDNYQATRNFPDQEGTSYLSPHLRFGTVGVREAIRAAIQSRNETFWQELIWREFFIQLLWHFPQTVNKAFKPAYDRIQWRNDEDEFKRWTSGTTGYPMVDAGMRELNQTGYMHNRVRMIVASFLCKHLLIDWRWGEAYFAEKLLDYEMASNVGNWQWAAGTGADAAPYFRIFNPHSQLEKFDSNKKYVSKWVPEWNSSTYPEPMVDHSLARERCLETYKAALR